METKKDILEHIKIKAQHKVDDTYFDQFRASMMEEIKKHPRTKVFYLKPSFWLSTVAASILILVCVQFFKPTPTNTFSNLTEEEILSYIEENTDDIEVESLPEIKSDKINQVIKKDSPEKKETIEKIDKNVELASLESFVSSEEILNEISAEDIYLYMNSEEFDLEELELSHFNF